MEKNSPQVRNYARLDTFLQEGTVPRECASHCGRNVPILSVASRRTVTSLKHESEQKEAKDYWVKITTTTNVIKYSKIIFICCRAHEIGLVLKGTISQAYSLPEQAGVTQL